MKTKAQPQLPIRRIVSGAQTGVDRAALDFAISHGIDHGGWVPKGRKAEDGPVSIIYRVLETRTSNYAERTRKNVLDSDGTLIIYENQLSGGTELTHTLAHQAHRPVLAVDIATTSSADAGGLVRDWISQNRILTLNIAGPRESQSPGIYSNALSLLEAVFVSSLS